LESFYNSSVCMYSIPIAFHCPSDTALKGCDTLTAQQIDIMPTVLNYLAYHKPFFAFGENLFNPTQRHFAITYINGLYQLIENDCILLFDGQNIVSFYNWKKQDQPSEDDFRLMLKDPVLKKKHDSMETFVKALLQVYTNRMNHNRLTP
jgi:hypothetical protein